MCPDMKGRPLGREAEALCSHQVVVYGRQFLQQSVDSIISDDILLGLVHIYYFRCQMCKRKFAHSKHWIRNYVNYL